MCWYDGNALVFMKCSMHGTVDDASLKRSWSPTARQWPRAVTAAAELEFNFFIAAFINTH